MSSADRNIASIAEGQHSVFSYGQATEAGFSGAAIQRRIQSGLWRRLHRGVFAISGASLSLRSRVMAAVLAGGTDACASHATAASLLGIDGFSGGSPVEVMIFDRRGIRIPGVIVHRPRFTVEGDKSVVDGIPITSSPRVFFDIAHRLPMRTLEAVFDNASRRGLVSLASIETRLRAVDVPGVRGTRRMARLVLDRSAHPLTESQLESMFARLIHKAGLPPPVPQHEVRRDDGTFVARVDFAYPMAKLAIELDGYAYHSGRGDWQRDRTRQNELVAAGWTPLRFTKADLASRGRSVIAHVSRRLLAAHSRPS